MKHEKYAEFKAKMAKIADLNYAEAVLGWDQQTQMPKQGANFRAQQMSTLKTLSHEMFVDPKFGDLISGLHLDDTLSDEERKNVALVHHDYSRKKKYPGDFVEEYTRLCADAYMIWADAKKTNQFSKFEPVLAKIVEFKKQEAEFLGYGAHPYEALMEDFEPGLTVKKFDEVFDQVKSQLFPFIKKIIEKQGSGVAKNELLSQHFAKADQWALSEKIIQQMGYSFESGRMDYAVHPFCTSFNQSDVRITTWVNEKHLNAMLFASVHETGHALYEMGVPSTRHYGLPLGQAISPAFHESQSRLWENNIARSLPYWKANYPLVQEQFPAQFKNVSLNDFYKAINQVTPSFIRVEADELTYHAHIYIRYLIEKSLIDGSIKVKDIPAFWNEKYRDYLGITPANDAQGCLQDMHWSFGGFGYFPTYSLGSFYAAQMVAQMKKENAAFDDQISRGDMAPTLKWLREKVHVHGRRYTSGELLTRVTGSDLKFDYFMDYAKKKYGEIYGV